jgi:hypothetical protein
VRNIQEKMLNRVKPFLDMFKIALFLALSAEDFIEESHKSSCTT